VPNFAARAALVLELVATCCLVAASPGALAHGGVVMEEDICVIRMGFLTAHFTIYQPETQRNEEFCEDIPDATQTLFVLDYLHSSLKEMPLEFRIIRDVTDLGAYARWEDVARLENLEDATVFHAPPRIQGDAIYSVEHRFDAPGWYIGIVTTTHPATGRTYQTVFPFQVGGGLGYLPLFLVLGLAAQLVYLMSNGTLARWWVKLSQRPRSGILNR
jgi:hypothetical protein